MKGRKLYGLMAIFFMASLMGCASSTGNVGIGEMIFTPEGNYSFVNSVIIDNQTLSRYIQIIDIKGRIVNNLLEAQVQVMNKYNRDYRMEYLYKWYDSKGFEIKTVKDHWTPVLVYGQEVKTLVGLAPNPEAVKFRINIRASHPIR